MKGIGILVILLIVFFLIGCANTADVKTAKIEADYRKEVLKMKKGGERDKKLLETVEERSYKEEILRCDNYMKEINPGTPEATLVFDQDSCRMEEVQRVRATPIEMPQEWFDQWNEESQVKTKVEQSTVEPIELDLENFEITDPCEQLGPAYC